MHSVGFLFLFLKKKKAASGREGQVDIKYMERWGDAIVAWIAPFLLSLFQFYTTRFSGSSKETPERYFFFYLFYFQFLYFGEKEFSPLGAIQVESESPSMASLSRSFSWWPFSSSSSRSYVQTPPFKKREGIRRKKKRVERNAHRTCVIMISQVAKRWWWPARPGVPS